MKVVSCAAVALAVCAGVALAQTQSKKPATAASRKPAPAAARPAPKPAAAAAHPGASRTALAGATHKTVARPVAGKTATSKTVAAGRNHASTSPRAATGRRGKRGRVPPRPPRQMAPAPERYQEIQQALVSKGYLPAEAASGVWDQTSCDALKRFQAEQKLQGTGKIDSLSLIALGLGPRHDSAEMRPAAPATSPESTGVQNP